MTVVDSVSVI